MLKIKDNVDLNILKDYGFMKDDLIDNEYSFTINDKKNGIIIIYINNNRIINIQSNKYYV